MTTSLTSTRDSFHMGEKKNHVLTDGKGKQWHLIHILDGGGLNYHHYYKQYRKKTYGFILVTYQFLVALIMQFSQVADKGQQRSITEENEMKHAGRNKGSKDQQTTSN